jgi:hypothetical protein
MKTHTVTPEEFLLSSRFLDNEKDASSMAHCVLGNHFCIGKISGRQNHSFLIIYFVLIILP